MLTIKNLKVTVDAKEILKGIDLEVRRGELHVLMGPNGSGKSTLAKVLAGSPELIVGSGEIRFLGKDLKKLSPDKRAQLGIFLAFQHPVEIPGVSVFNVLRRAKQPNGPSKESPLKGRANGKVSAAVFRNSAAKKNRFNVSIFRQELLEHASALKLSQDFLSRALNEGFSGGEKKRSEILQMLALKPRLVILDEIDSGLDVDALKLVAAAINNFSVLNPQSSVLLITHYARILKYLEPDFVHVMIDGKIIKSGKLELAKLVEEKGYQAWQTV